MAKVKRFLNSPNHALLAITLALLTAFASAQNAHPAPIQQPHASKKSGQPPIVFWNTPLASVNRLLLHVPQANPLRFAQLKQTYRNLLCRASSLREQTFSGGKNLLCTLPSGLSPNRSSSQSPYSPGIILFIADYEHEGSGQSAVDNWSGALMLPFIYHALSAAPRRHTFLFADVEGKTGAKALFNSLSAQERRNIRGVVALECLGLDSLRYYVNPHDSTSGSQSNWLTHQIKQAAYDQRVRAPISSIPGDWFKVDVTREFRYHNIQSVSLFSVGFMHRKIPGSAQDTPAALNPGAYYRSLMRLSVYAVELDRPWPSIPSKNGYITAHSLL